MFNSYQELFWAYGEFYRANLFAGPTSALVPSKASAQATSPELDCALVGLAKNDTHNPSGGLGSLVADLGSQWSASACSEKLAGPTAGSAQFEEPDGRIVTIGSYNSLDMMDFIYTIGLFALFLLLKMRLSQSMRRSKLIESLGLRPKDSLRS